MPAVVGRPLTENHRILVPAASGDPTVSLVRDDELAFEVGRPGRSSREDEELDAVVCGTGERRVRRPPVTGRDERPVGVVPLGVAPGPIRTPPIPSTFPEEKVKSFGAEVPMRRPGQPNGVASRHLFLACGTTPARPGRCRTRTAARSWAAEGAGRAPFGRLAGHARSRRGLSLLSRSRERDPERSRAGRSRRRPPRAGAIGRRPVVSWGSPGRVRSDGTASPRERARAV